MGRSSREHRERVAQGLEEPFRNNGTADALRNPIARTATKLASRKGVIDELSKGSVSDQSGRLDELVGTGTLSPSKLRSAIKAKAPKEMDKAIRKFQKKGIEVSVDTLCADVRSEPRFLKTCESVGLSLEWFEQLARDRMQKHGLGSA